MKMRRAITLCLAMVIAGLVASVLLEELQMHPISSVKIVGEFKEVSQVGLERKIADSLANGFFGTDVAALRDLAMDMPWIREVSVRRVWPGALHIAVSERQAVARWNDESLIEEDATLFAPPDAAGRVDLPWLRGPSGEHGFVLSSFGRFADTIEQLDRQLVGLELDERGAWRLALTNDVSVLLGRGQGQAELERLSQAFVQVAAAGARQVSQIDLRYEHGFAIRWVPMPETAIEGDADGAEQDAKEPLREARVSQPSVPLASMRVVQ